MKELIHWINYVLYFSIDELKRQHARSAFGYFWIVLSQFVNIVGIAVVFGALFKQDLSAFFPFISAGIISWNLFSTFTNESTRLYSGNASIIQNFSFPLWIFVGQLLMKNLIIFAHGIVIHFLIVFVLKFKLGIGVLLFIPNLAIILGLMVMLGRTFAFLGGRFRDFSPAIGNLIYLFFLVTPIIWEKKTFPKDYAWLLNLNPFTHLIDLLRSPLIGTYPEPGAYYFVFGIGIVLLIIQKLFVEPQERRIVFYV